jgi:hypothetical protein
MSLIEAGPKETIKRDYGQELVLGSERALVGDLRPRRARTSISTISFLAHRVWMSFPRPGARERRRWRRWRRWMWRTLPCSSFRFLGQACSRRSSTNRYYPSKIAIVNESRITLENGDIKRSQLIMETRAIHLTRIVVMRVFEPAVRRATRSTPLLPTV